MHESEGGVNIASLIDHLKMFPQDMEVYIQTTPNDLASPVERKHISLNAASHSERYGLEQSKVFLTAFFPEVKS